MAGTKTEYAAGAEPALAGAGGAHNIITQVQQHAASIISSATAAVARGAPGARYDGYDEHYEHHDHGGLITLDVRGYRFTIPRHELMSLPESVLLGLFPNGIFLDGQGNMISNLAGMHEVVVGEYSPRCLQYVLDVFHRAEADAAARADAYDHGAGAKLSATVHDLSAMIVSSSPLIASVLAIKPALIVLQEDLDYYIIPPPTMPYPEVQRLKKAVGRRLLQQNEIFKSLKISQQQAGENAADEPSTVSAERHLVEMLCSSGFQASDTWGFRERELNKTVISSLALVRLLATDETDAKDDKVPQMNAMAQKLLIFWRKPARKCWWDQLVVDGLDQPDPAHVGPVPDDARPATADSATASAAAASPTPSTPSAGSHEYAEHSAPARDDHHRHFSLHKYMHPHADARERELEARQRHAAEDRLLDLAERRELQAPFAGLDRVKVHVRRVWTLELSVMGVR
ncbi:uncharacterized protein V1510DRAFT_423012 [Dipodascopsis tothii]|uniref:uncharacterized protein n=1 Tax=Dipodascopsis tothii TaxID=44089 RepID=UPI0034CD3A92